MTIPVLFYVFTNGAVWSPSHFSICFGAMAAWVIAASWGCGLTCIVGVDVGAGGIGQSFLDSNKFSDVDPALAHGVPALVWISSSGGGLSPADEPPWGGFFLEFSLG